METARSSDPFDSDVESIDDYKERFDYYCTAYGIADERKKALFLTRIGQKMYTKLKVWVSPTSIGGLSLHEIVTRLKARTLPETVEIAERYRFFKRQQKADEKVTEYMSELRSLAKSCNFGNYLDTALRDQFVCGLKDRKIQQGLLCTRNLTVGQALDKSRSRKLCSRKHRTCIKRKLQPGWKSQKGSVGPHIRFSNPQEVLATVVAV